MLHFFHSEGKDETPPLIDNLVEKGMLLGLEQKN